MLYGGLGTAANPLAATRGGPLDPQLLDVYARFPVAAIPLSPSTDDRPDIIAGLRARNQDQIILGYVTACASHATWAAPENAGMIVGQAHAVSVAEEGWHEDWGLVNVDITANKLGPTLGPLLAQVWCQDLTKVDGLFLDIFAYEAPNEVNETNFPGTSAAKRAQWPIIHAQMADIIRTAAGNERIIVGNYGVPSNMYLKLNGWMRENFPNLNGGTWVSNMIDGAPTYPGGYLPDSGLYKKKPYMGTIFTAAQGSGITYNPLSAENQRRMRWGIGSACLGDGAFVFAPSDIPVDSLYYNWWFDEYAVDPSGRASTNKNHTLWLGVPTSPAILDPVGGTGFYYRTFTNGIVVVNPTLNVRTLTLPRMYKRILGTSNPALNTGAMVGAVTLNQQDAAILVNP